jgi:hypothetical protein
VRIREEDISKTPFKIIYGNYEFTVVAYGLSNAPTIFMFWMNGVFRNKFVIVFMGDIFITQIH